MPLANLCGDLIGDNIYVAGSDHNFQKYFLKINVDNPSNGWQFLPVWDGSPRTHALGVAQNNGEETCFYLFKGRIDKKDQRPSSMLRDSWMYVPSQNEWREIALGK